jgi:cell division protein ZapB
MPILLQLGLNNRIDPLYSSRLTFKLSASVDINTLEKRIDELIALCDELESKQGAMETDRDNWMQERTRLLEKNEMAKSKIEAMIMRLKSLEQD